MTWACPTSQYHLKFADFKGDGSKQLVCADKGTGDIWIADFDPLTKSITPINGDMDPDSVLSGYVGTLWSVSGGSAPCLSKGSDVFNFADFNGDGKADAICASAGIVWVAIFNGNSFEAINTFQNPQSVGYTREGYVGVVYNGNNFSGNSHSNFLYSFADFNGDGKADFVRYGNYWEDDAFVSISTGVGLAAINADTGYLGGAFPAWEFAQYVGSQFYSADFNVAISNGISTIPLYGGSSTDKSQYYAGATSACDFGTKKMDWFDLNDDGRSDPICYDGTLFSIYYNLPPTPTPVTTSSEGATGRTSSSASSYSGIDDADFMLTCFMALGLSAYCLYDNFFD